MPEYPARGKAYAPKGEEIIGIPRKRETHPIRLIPKPEKWELSVQKHLAHKAGDHLDLRIGDAQEGHAHSWALRKWPKPGEKVLAIRQPTHSIPYMDWSGVILKGYGAGGVEVADRRAIDVVSAGPEKITFASGPGELYTLVRTSGRDGKAWLLLNRTPPGPK